TASKHAACARTSSASNPPIPCQVLVFTLGRLLKLKAGRRRHASWAKDGALTGPDKEHAETSMLALHLLQASLVHVFSESVLSPVADGLVSLVRG
ncbi:hypothetical protein ACFVFJ_44720, partial [Streptomyces sp. NPDC057717]|uniref:hypothetical protein n=1 Tax=Streptomyces sp. NPDC057717 TaxID=3346224 RepID=UPI0036758208